MSEGAAGAHGQQDGPAFYCLWLGLLLVAAVVIASIDENELQLEEIEHGGTHGGYSDGRVAEALFKGMELEGFIVFREGGPDVDTKIVVGLLGLQRNKRYTWHIHDGEIERAGACVAGRFLPGDPDVTPGPGELSSPGQGWDMSKRHGPIATMAHHEAGTLIPGDTGEAKTSLVAGVFFDPRLHLSGDHSVRFPIGLCAAAAGVFVFFSLMADSPRGCLRVLCVASTDCRQHHSVA